MWGKMLTHVWLTQTKSVPQGVPLRTRPFSVKSLDGAVPLVVLQIMTIRSLAGVDSEQKKKRVHSMVSNSITHLHSYSTPFIDMIVREFSWSIPSIAGWRSPSLHCNDPHITFLQTKFKANIQNIWDEEKINRILTLLRISYNCRIDLCHSVRWSILLCWIDRSIVDRQPHHHNPI